MTPDPDQGITGTGVLSPARWRATVTYMSDLGLLDARDASRVEAVVAAHDLPVRLARPLPVAALMEAMARDKKVRAGALRFVLLESLGRAVVRPDVPAPAVLAVWKEVGAGA